MGKMEETRTTRDSAATRSRYMKKIHLKKADPLALKLLSQ
jgi:hypothetical protein